MKDVSAKSGFLFRDDIDEKILHSKYHTGNTKKDFNIDFEINQQVTTFQILLTGKRELCKL